ncbi:hypothetical protein D9757_005749 [Collybiopsis confluens]|uniref:F-box domain-containing protein n=1 Tax=Collybiopsis confluens TaxID=2823264 RepID=A0A8H5HPY9_9AGAR|nr:hypothetical protein D9757_005749 [Collybiopsis confluens]
MASYFDDLPVETIEEVILHLDPLDVSAMSSTSRFFRDLIYHAPDQHLWRELYLAQPFDDPIQCVSQNGESRRMEEEFNWKSELQAIIRARTVLEDVSICRPQERVTVLRTLLRMVSWVPPLRSYDDMLNNLSQNLLYVTALTRGGVFLDPEKLGLPVDGPEIEQEEAQLRAQLHAIIGITPADRRHDTTIGARAFCYNLRNYNWSNEFGPFLPSNVESGGAGKVNWIHIRHIHHIISTHLLELTEEGQVFEVVIYPLSFPYTQIVIPEGMDLDEEEDWAGVNGLWLLSFCFVDHTLLLRYNNIVDSDINEPRSLLLTGPAFREMFRSMQVTLKVTKAKEDPKHPGRPRIYFVGVVAEPSTSIIHGYVEMTDDNHIRWHFVSGEQGQALWSSEGLQVGGVRSSYGVLGSWTTIFHDVDDPVGPFWLRKPPLNVEVGVTGHELDNERLRVGAFAMTSDIESDAAQASAKGKGRAEDTERTPLLASGSSRSTHTQHLTPHAQRRLGLLRFLCIFSTALLICIIFALALFLLLAWSYFRSSEMPPDDVLHKALVFEGPDRVDVLNISFSDGIWVQVEGRVGLDAGSVVGVNSDPQDGILDSILKGFGKWGVKNLNTVAVSTSTISIMSRSDPPEFLANVTLPPLEIPLTVDPPRNRDAWLQRISTPVHLQPTAKTSALLHFAQESWKNGQVMVTTEISTVEVRGGGIGGSNWKHALRRTLSDVVTSFSVKGALCSSFAFEFPGSIIFLVPEIPGVPHPGRNTPIPPLADLVTLQSFQLINDLETDNLSIQAVASVVDPAPRTFNLTTPTISFLISLLPLAPADPTPIPIAAVQTHSFELTYPNITLEITGHVLPLPSTGAAFPTLSKFLTHYLSGLSNPISISTPLIHDMNVELAFPAPNPKPRILRNVTIRDMKLKPNAKGTMFLASGIVQAFVVLPKGMNLELDVKKILPDDGVLAENTALAPEAPPLPDPLPERAFGHIRPEDWVDAKSVKLRSNSSEGPEGDEGSEFAVSAKIIDVPLEVLPGRQKEFSDFVSKIIFGSSAIAGILGTTAVGVHVPGIPGLPNEGPWEDSLVEPSLLELSGLPFRGSVKLGKGNMLKGFWKGTEEGWKHREKEWEKEMEDQWKDALRKMPHWPR